MRALVWLVLCLGCGSSTVHGVSSTPEPPRAEAWAFSTLPPGAHAEPTAMLADGEAWVIAFGPVRVRVEGETIEVAEQVTASAIADIASFDGLWLFVTAAGEVFSAPAPLGELSPVGTLDGRPLGSVVSSTAHLAILDDRGHLFVGDASGIARVETEGPVVDAAFATASFGGRIDATGRFFITRGGAWEPLELSGAPTPYLVYPVGEELAVWTDQGVEHRVNARGEVHAPSDDESGSETEGPDDALVARAYRAAAGFLGLRSPFTSDGRVLAFDTNGRAEVLPAGTEIALPVRTDDAVAALGAYNTVRVRVWGTSFVAFSDEGWVRSDGTTPFAPFAPGFEGELVFDGEGRRFVRRGRCPAESVPPASQHEEDENEDGEPEDEYGDEYGEDDEEIDETAGLFLCVVDGALRTEVEIGEYHQVVGIASEDLYVLVDGGQLRRIDLASGAAVVLGEVEIGELSVTPDGSFYGEVDRDWRWGPSWDAMVPVRLPTVDGEHAWSFQALDARRAVAWRDRRVFVTEDGGATFTELHPARWDGAFAPSADCNAHGCLIGRTLWAPASFAPPNRPVASIAGAATGIAWGSFQPPMGIDVACEVPVRLDGHPLTTPPLAASSERAWFGRGWLALSGRGAFESGALRGQLGGLAEGVAFRADVRGTVPALAPLDGMDRDEARASVELVLATPRFAIFHRGLGDDRYETGDLVILPVRGTPRVIGPFLDLVETWDAPPVVGGALTSGEGAVVWIRHPGLFAERHRPDVLVVVAPDGSAAVHRFESGAVDAERALARDEDGRPGLLVERAGESFLLGVDGSVRGPLPPIPSRVSEVTSACGVRASGAIDLVPRASVRLGLELRWGRVAATHDLVLTLAPDGSACVRELSAAYAPSDDAGAAVLVTAEPAGLVGRLTSSAGTSPPFACRIGEGWLPGSAAGVVRLVPLAGGAVGLATSARGLLLGTLRNATWDLVPAEVPVLDDGFVLSDAGSQPLVLGFGPPSTRSIPGETAPLEPGVVGEASGTVLRVLPETRELVAVRGGESGAPVGFDDRVPLAASLAPHGSGLAGLVTTCRSVLDYHVHT